MSGICGLWEPGRPFDATALGPMLRGLQVSPTTQETRLSRVARSAALATSSRWPFQTIAEVAGVVVAADADLVNRAELLQSLGDSADQAGACSTAEVVARLYRKHGMDFLNRLQGGFSIALWDKHQERLILAIDKLGIKSLYWRNERGRLLFASRLRCVRAAQEERLDPNRFAILQFLLFAAVPAPLTSDAGSHKLSPGTYLQATRDAIVQHTYWDLEYCEETDKSVDQWAEDLQNAMRAAVHRHVESGRPERMGCFLSGGTDSSSVVAFTSEKLRPTRSFSIAFQEEAFSEIAFARTTAKAFQTEHHEKFLNPEDAWSALDRILEYYDEPFANSSAIGSYYCAEMARQQGVETLLGGDGGDELFGGNERYATDKRFAFYHSIPPWLRSRLIEPLTRFLPEGGRLSLPKRYIRRANIPNPRRIMSYNFFLSHSAAEIFEEGFLEHLQATNWLSIPEEHFHRPQAASELNRILYLDAKMTLADNDLRKVSGTAELAGVNVRYPLLDDQLARFASTIPSHLKLKGFEKRYLFKRAMKGILPHKVLYKEKHGFGVPLAQWLLQNPKMLELKNDLTSDARTRQRGYFRPDFFDRLTRLHQDQPNFYGEIVWYLLALEVWHRTHMDGARETAHVS